MILFCNSLENKHEKLTCNPNTWLDTAPIMIPKVRRSTEWGILTSLINTEMFTIMHKDSHFSLFKDPIRMWYSLKVISLSLALSPSSDPSLSFSSPSLSQVIFISIEDREHQITHISWAVPCREYKRAQWEGRRSRRSGRTLSHLCAMAEKKKYEFWD